MGATFVTVDLGNSFLKVRLWRTSARGQPPSRAERVRGAELSGVGAGLASRLQEWLERLDEPFDAALSSVAGAELEELIAGVLIERADRAHLQAEPGLVNLCRVPELVGRDRLWAARGALTLAGKSCLVVDAGTALTVDAVRAGGSPNEPGEPGVPGEFLGGAIAPGPDLGARALAEWAARLPRVEPRPDPRALGRDTEEAICAGLSIGFRGAAGELARCVAEEAGFESPAVVVAGGARAHLLLPARRPSHPFSFLRDSEPLECEDLVHLGLLAGAFEPA